jgi:hypothetical protein
LFPISLCACTVPSTGDQQFLTEMLNVGMLQMKKKTAVTHLLFVLLFEAFTLTIPWNSPLLSLPVAKQVAKQHIT